MNKKIKTILICSGIILLILILIFFLYFKSKSKTEIVKVNIIQDLTSDENEYSFSIGEIELEEEQSPVYECASNKIPSYLQTLADSIDTTLESSNNGYIFLWSNSNGPVLTYVLTSSVLEVNLNDYPKSIPIESIENFINSYLDSQIIYCDLSMQDLGSKVMYMGNRCIDNREIVTGFGQSDYYVVESGYLKSARILVAEISTTEYTTPLITDTSILEKYLQDSEYPKNMTIDSTNLFTLDYQTYEDYDPIINYDSCSINEIAPKLYFYSTNQTYLYYAYSISGTCDVEYENSLLTVAFRGFINAVDPEYVITQ